MAEIAVAWGLPAEFLREYKSQMSTPEIANTTGIMAARLLMA
ncbi:MAG TPA: hypothetical protein VK709_11340 [Candidatus Saccharimonadales bacterium]|nr:hypothetical protein [Candidatus Saccharimonadales bacterium]